MVKANELRIGNYLYDSNGAVITVTAEMILHIDRTISFNPPTPIPLTSEILEKCKISKFFYISKHDHKDLYGYEFYYKPAEELNWVPLHYLHQLQNLYFALTGEELTLKFDLANSTVD